MGINHYENFPVASWLLPSRFRPAIEAIYHFARRADDLADEGHDPANVRLTALDGIAAELTRIETGQGVTDPAFASLQQAVARDRLPIQYLRDLLSAFRQDVIKTRYETYDELLDYCVRSANPVGRLVLHVLNVRGEYAEQRADHICTALQLINHWQDIAVDWRKGRVYLPQEDLRRYGISEKDIAQGVCNSAWHQLMAWQITRTRALMCRGRSLAYDIPGRLGWELRAMVAGGLAIAQRIEAVDYDVFRHRPTLTMRDKLSMLWAVVHQPANRFS